MAKISVLYLLLVSAFSLSALVGPSEAAVYKVGDSAGWTIIGNVNYTAWAANKSFHVGDVIMFVYNSNFHNVMEVSKDEYKSCNATSPVATYTTGNDSITIKRGGHHFFFCGFPGHCAIGQKVDIRVPKGSSAAPSAAPAASPSAASTPSAAGGAAATPALSPRASAAPRPALAFATAALALAAVAAALILA